jgi:ABC-type dipeptide/oligopeptide/nickel transport system permease subunit
VLFCLPLNPPVPRVPRAIGDLRTRRYVLGENRVTPFAFGLLVIILFAAIFGPYIVPYDPLASDTAAALKPPSRRTGSAPINWAAISSAASSSRHGSTRSLRLPRWRWCF